MKLQTKISLSLATLVFAMAFFTAKADAKEELSNCQFVYGGGQICGVHTPVDTGLEANALFTLSAALYASGLGSFVVARNADKMVPFLG
jgi:hypothetical protein